MRCVRVKQERGKNTAVVCGSRWFCCCLRACFMRMLGKAISLRTEYSLEYINRFIWIDGYCCLEILYIGCELTHTRISSLFICSSSISYYRFIETVWVQSTLCRIACQLMPWRWYRYVIEANAQHSRNQNHQKSGYNSLLYLRWDDISHNRRTASDITSSQIHCDSIQSMPATLFKTRLNY